MTRQVGHDMRPAEMVERIGRRDPVIVECGAHDGRDTVKFLNAFPDCRIFCFEPDPRPLDRTQPPGFRQRIGNDHRVSLIQRAVTNHDGRALLFRSSGTPPDGCKWKTDDWDHSSSVLRPTGHLDRHKWVTFPAEKRLGVLTVRLDSWLAKQPEVARRGIDLLWADVQGAEAILIAGARETLRKTRWFYTEFSDKEMYAGEPALAKIQELLPEWELVELYCENALFKRKDL